MKFQMSKMKMNPKIDPMKVAAYISNPLTVTFDQQQPQHDLSGTIPEELGTHDDFDFGFEDRIETLLQQVPVKFDEMKVQNCIDEEQNLRI